MRVTAFAFRRHLSPNFTISHKDRGGSCTMTPEEIHQQAD